MTKAIELKGVTKKLGDFHLGPLTFSVPTGCVVGYIGENGAGKSTTIKLLLGLMEADSGQINILGKPLEKITVEQKKDIAYVFDDLFLPGEMNLANVQRFHRLLYGKAWQDRIFQSLIKSFNLSKERRVKDLSRGMKMQLGLAVALSHGAKLLLLDEATSGLDPVIRDDVLDILLDYLQDESHTVFISSHILSDLEKIADYIAFIHKGELLFMENKDSLAEEYGIASLTEDQLQDLDSKAVVGFRKHRFGIEALVKRDLIPADLSLDKASIEDIMVFTIKEDKNESLAL
ncbi:MAG: ABC transporter ATP-binding protein [Eubacteriales bacterium]|nr:ABC transporter ATP-binding protein [Eubacteriales bacterium]